MNRFAKEEKEETKIIEELKADGELAKFFAHFVYEEDLPDFNFRDYDKPWLRIGLTGLEGLSEDEASKIIYDVSASELIRHAIRDIQVAEKLLNFKGEEEDEKDDSGSMAQW